MPEWVVCRRCVVWEEDGGVSASASESERESKVAEGARGMERVEGTGDVVEGKWPVWKVERGRRRVPERDFGSGLEAVSRGREEGKRDYRARFDLLSGSKCRIWRFMSASATTRESDLSKGRKSPVSASRWFLERPKSSIL